MALVIGTESTGASPAMLRVATKRVYLPLHGFADSLNLSVATAMVIQVFHKHLFIKSCSWFDVNDLNMLHIL